MSESKTHMKLVEIAYEYIKSIVSNEDACLIYADMPTTKRPSKVIDNYIPDILFWQEDILIIGEAKTKNDFLRIHSQEQYKAYLEECKNFYGRTMLVICVPWDMLCSAKNYFRRLVKKTNSTTDIVIVNELGKAIRI